MAVFPNLGTTGNADDLTVNDEGVNTLIPIVGTQPGDRAIYLTGLYPIDWAEPPKSIEAVQTGSTNFYLEDDKVAPLWENTGSLSTAADLDYVETLVNNDRHFAFPGTSGNYLSVPDEAALDITTSISITARISTNWDNRLRNQRIVAKSGPGRGYEFFIGYDTAHATLAFGHNGSTMVASNRKLPFFNGQIGWVRVTYNSVGNSTRFYTAPDQTSEPSTWTELGTAQTTVTGAMAVNANSLKIGTYDGTNDMFSGKVYNVIIRNAETAGSVVLNIDVPTDTLAMVQDVTTTFTATSGQTVTLNTSGSPPSTVRIIAADTVAATHNYYENDVVSHLTLDAGEAMYMYIKLRIPSTISTTDKEIVPLAGCGDPYSTGNFNFYLDTFKNQVVFDARQSVSGVGTGYDLFATGYGVSVTNGMGDITILVYLSRSVFYTSVFMRGMVDGTTTVLYPSNGGVNGHFNFSTSNPIIPVGATTPLKVYGNAALGVEVVDAGITLEPGFGNYLSWPDISLAITDRLSALANGEALYRPTEFWIATGSSGSLPWASGDTVQEGDILLVNNAGEYDYETYAGDDVVWRHISIDDPERRTILYRPTSTTLDAVPDLVIASNEYFFMWAVAAGSDDWEYMAEGWGGGSNDSLIDMELGLGYAFWEIDTVDGEYQYAEYEGDIWAERYSDPTLIAIGIDRATANLVAKLVSSTGVREPIEWQGEGFFVGEVNLNETFSFLSESNPTDRPTFIWGGGWDISTEPNFPSDGQLNALWHNIVYGS